MVPGSSKLSFHKWRNSERGMESYVKRVSCSKLWGETSEALIGKLLLRRSLSPTWGGHPNPEAIAINSSVQVQFPIFKWAECLLQGHLSLDLGPTLIQMVSPGYLTLTISARNLLPNKVTSWGSGWMYLLGATIQPTIVDISLSYFCDRIVLTLSIGNEQKRK